MVSIYWLIPLYLVHWFADFIMQPQHNRENKWHDNGALTGHIGYYSILWWITWAIFLITWDAHNGTLMVPFSLFVLINIGSHWIIDYVTSRESHKYFAVKDYWNGFNVVGFDQMLHYLILTISFLVLF